MKKGLTDDATTVLSNWSHGNNSRKNRFRGRKLEVFSCTLPCRHCPCIHGNMLGWQVISIGVQGRGLHCHYEPEICRYRWHPCLYQIAWKILGSQVEKPSLGPPGERPGRQEETACETGGAATTAKNKVLWNPRQKPAPGDSLWLAESNCCSAVWCCVPLCAVWNMAAQEKLDPWSHRDESPVRKSLRQDRGKGETQGQQKRPGSRLRNPSYKWPS